MENRIFCIFEYFCRHLKEKSYKRQCAYVIFEYFCLLPKDHIFFAIEAYFALSIYSMHFWRRWFQELEYSSKKVLISYTQPSSIYATKAIF